MGGCCSDMKGGKQAVGGLREREGEEGGNNNNNGAQNDAVEFFYRTQGFHQFYTQVEVSTFHNFYLCTVTYNTCPRRYRSHFCF